MSYYEMEKLELIAGAYKLGIKVQSQVVARWQLRTGRTETTVDLRKLENKAIG